MKTQLKYASLAILNAVLLISCSERHNLKIGMEYKMIVQEQVFNSVVYVFSDKGVSVYKVVGNGENICIQKKDGKLISSDGSTAGNNYWYRKLHGVGAPKGSTLTNGSQDDNPLEVIFGPGDRMPVLESASYKIEGTSVFVDWSKGHSKYFELSHSDSGSEVFTIKNDGLILDSSTSPGLILTANMASGGR